MRLRFTRARLGVSAALAPDVRNLPLVVLFAACSTTTSSPPGAEVDAGGPDDPSVPTCVDVDDSTAVAVGTADGAEEYALSLRVRSESATKWDDAGNEALVLEVSGEQRGLIGHLVIHQGKTEHDYTMHLGALAAGEALRVRVSTLSAPNATRHACVFPADLTPASALGEAAKGLLDAPEFRWPIEKRFDDIPVVVGWSKARAAYQTVFTNEDGGTVAQCGGGADGVRAEIARWGRASDIEGSYSYGGASPRWERCTGTVPTTTTAVRLEGAHPILYFGDGHNRLFENRGGYGQTCGSATPEKPNGDLEGWNKNNPGNGIANDDGHVIILRPLPVDMDALGFARFGDRREGLADTYAPWVYRLTTLELSREGKIDGNKTLAMSRYLYVDVRVADVGGSGDQYCATLGVRSGFKLRAITTSGVQIDGPQITADYASNGAHDYKRVAIPLPAGVGAADIDHFVFDAYDGDGIYVTALGDAFIPIADGPNGAKLDYVRTGETEYAYYVDDNSNSCNNGVNTDGPGGTAYACKGGQVTLPR